ncbi:hypothetical protein O988_08272 [Pseudogymnoascus sp. VKM F-3808]|nr:hypothetical protein O988_08272 [Pseudogymnoascus sp. VKM F-3808]
MASFNCGLALPSEFVWTWHNIKGKNLEFRAINVDSTSDGTAMILQPFRLRRAKKLQGLNEYNFARAITSQLPLTQPCLPRPASPSPSDPNRKSGTSPRCFSSPNDDGRIPCTGPRSSTKTATSPLSGAPRLSWCSD